MSLDFQRFVLELPSDLPLIIESYPECPIVRRHATDRVVEAATMGNEKAKNQVSVRTISEYDVPKTIIMFAQSPQSE